MKFFNDEDWRCGDTVVYLNQSLAKERIKGHIRMFMYSKETPWDRTYDITWDDGTCTAEKAYVLQNLDV